MKKTVLALCAIALVSLAATSCKKQCTCTAKVAGLSVSYDAGEMKPSECKDFVPPVEAFGGNVSASCATE